MSGIFYFPRYTQRENFITNNTLLLMHRLYDDNRLRFQRFLGLLLEEQADEPIGEIGLKISQQVGGKGSVLDGFLHQPAIRIGIETKRSGVDFNIKQLMSHLDAFEAGTSGYLILLRPNEIDLSLPQWQPLQKKANKKNVILASVTFERVISSFRTCLMAYDEAMHDLIDDFETFCSEEGLLDTDKFTMLVPPCRLSFSINSQCHLYFCPATRSHRRVRYLGIYKEKSVRYIGEIEDVIFAELKTNGRLTCQNEHGDNVRTTADKKKRIREAMTMAKRQENDWDITHGTKFFICDQLFSTNFQKTSPGGIQGHRYLLLKDYVSQKMSLPDLAEALKSKSWQ